MTLRGGRGTKEAGEILKRISDTPADKQLTLVATGRLLVALGCVVVEGSGPSVTLKKTGNAPTSTALTPEKIR